MLCAAEASRAGRYDDLVAEAAKGPDLLRPAVATYFGAGAHEEFVAVGAQPDGTIVAFGNSWGPDFPALKDVTVLGTGAWPKVSEYPEGQEYVRSGRETIRRDPSPRFAGRGGMMVFYSPDARRVLRAVRFDWSVATITTGAIDADGGLLISGTCSEAFRAVAKTAGMVKTVANPQTGPRTTFGKVYWNGVTLSGDAYVARLSPDGRKLQWVWLFEGHRRGAARLFRLRDGSLAFHVRGLKVLSADRTALSQAELPQLPGDLRFMAVAPADGGAIQAGCVSAATGRYTEPRRPEVYATAALVHHDRAGRPDWQLYNWPGPLLGHDAIGAAAESTIRSVAYDRAGNLLVAGQARGFDSVLQRSPVDLRRRLAGGGLNFGPADRPVAAGRSQGPAISHLLRIRPGTFEVVARTEWMAVDPRSGRPMGASVDGMAELRDGSVALYGLAEAMLVQTPGGFVPAALKIDPRAKRAGYAGPYVAVLGSDLAHLRCAAYLPGCTIAGVGEVRGGLAVVGRAEARDAGGVAGPTRHAAQAGFGGGRWDAHLVLLLPAPAP